MKTVFLVKFQGVVKVSEEDMDNSAPMHIYERKVEASSPADVKVLLNRLFLFVDIISCVELHDEQ